MRIPLLALASLALAPAATAQVALSLPLALGPNDSVSTQTYTCGEAEPFRVHYINAGANALAILPIEGEDRIFVNVVSASGARYVSGQHVWWTKGDTAMLENEMQETARLDCTAK